MVSSPLTALFGAVLLLSWGRAEEPGGPLSGAVVGTPTRGGVPAFRNWERRPGVPTSEVVVDTSTPGAFQQLEASFAVDTQR